MFSVVFPGQGSQILGMGKVFYDKYENVKNLFKEADETLNFPLTKLIFEGPKEKLDLTSNTQPAIFLVSYSIFYVIKNEFDIDLNKAKYFAGHSLGEYSALYVANSISFSSSNISLLMLNFIVASKLEPIILFDLFSSIAILASCLILNN